MTEDPRTNITGYTWGAIGYTDNPAVIAVKNTEYTVAVTNPISRDLGSLKITKAVTGDVPPSFSQVFTFDVLCTLTGSADITFNNLAINYPTATFVTQGNIPTGYSCAVTEDPRTNVTGYTWGAIGYTGNPAVIAVKNTEYTVAVTNPISRDLGSLKITKAVTGDVPPSFSQIFTFDVLCTLTGSADITFNNLAINYPTATFVTQGNIPTGYSCAVTEDPRTNVTGYTWGAIGYTGNPAVIAVKNTEYTVAVGNPITRDLGTSRSPSR